MMKMSRSSILRLAVLVLCTGTLGSTMVHAQDGPPPPQGRRGGPGGPGGGGPEQQQRQLERMTQELSLTPDQVTSIKAIQDDGRKQGMAVREDESIAGPDKRTKMMAITEASQTKIKAVLTADQKVKYDAMMEKMKEQRGRRQEGSAPPPPPPPPPPSN